MGSSEGLPPKGYEILVLGTADWDALIATNQHFVAEGLLALGPVEFVESLGLRRPRFAISDVKRVVGRLARATGRHRSATQRRPVPSGLSITSPLVLPWHARWAAPLNRRLIRRATHNWRQSKAIRVLYAFTPTTYGLEDESAVCIYHCVDLLGTVPGINNHVIDRHERLLSRRADLAIATSQAVEHHLRSISFKHLERMPNVADVDLFRASAREATDRRPQIVFAGNLVSHKVDFPLLDALVRSLAPHFELVLAGPSTSGLPEDRTAIADLVAAGATWTGPLSHAELATILGSSLVGLIPYNLNDYTTGVSPLKVYEYLAAGLAVVSTPLPEVAAIADGRHVQAIERGSFIDAVEAVLATSDFDIGVRQNVAMRHGWPERQSLIREYVVKHVT